MTELCSPKSLAIFFRVYTYALILTKKIGWATFWAIFSANSSGHPDPGVSSESFSSHFELLIGSPSNFCACGRTFRTLTSENRLSELVRPVPGNVFVIFSAFFGIFGIFRHFLHFWRFGHFRRFWRFLHFFAFFGFFGFFGILFVLGVQNATYINPF
jgi:hypothetical protein